RKQNASPHCLSPFTTPALYKKSSSVAPAALFLPCDHYPRASERMNELTDCFSADTFPSLKRRGGCAADGVVSSAKLFRPKDFADLTTPSARTKVASRHFLGRASTPPFQGGE